MRGNPAYAIATIGVLCWGATARGQVTFRWIAASPANWSQNANWDDGTGFNSVPDGDLDDSAWINNGGTALITTGQQDVRNLTIGNGTLDMSGGELTVFGNLSNAGTLRIQGPTPELNVDGNFTNTGRLVAAISGANHGRIDIGGTANLGGTLAIQIAGAAPAIGSNWDILMAGNILGKFANVDTSATPELPRGVQYQLLTTNTTAKLRVDNSLILTVDRVSGAASISNVIGDSIEIDGYSILSNNGLLRGNQWNKLETAGGGWKAAPASNNSLVELNLTGSSNFNVGQSHDLGHPYVAGFIRPADEDLRFEYTSPNGDIVEGIVEYTGPINDIVLAIDPATGAAEIRNLSPFGQVAAHVDGYAITSSAGSLRPAQWSTFQQSGLAGPGWQAAPGSNNGLVELNLNNATLFNQGKVAGLGNIFMPGAARDLVFEYSARPLNSPVGDANGDNVVNLVDFNILKTNFGSSNASLSQGDFNGDGDVNLVDFNLLKSNFGQMGQPGAPDVFRGTVVYTGLAGGGAAVPEPSTWCLLLLGVALAGAGKTRLGGCRSHR